MDPRCYALLWTHKIMNSWDYSSFTIPRTIISIFKFSMSLLDFKLFKLSSIYRNNIKFCLFVLVMHNYMHGLTPGKYRQGNLQALQPIILCFTNFLQLYMVRYICVNTMLIRCTQSRAWTLHACLFWVTADCNKVTIVGLWVNVSRSRTLSVQIYCPWHLISEAYHSGMSEGEQKT